MFICQQLFIYLLNFILIYLLFASEINKYAMKITNKNYPNTIQIGDVTKVQVEDLPKIFT